MTNDVPPWVDREKLQLRRFEARMTDSLVVLCAPPQLPTIVSGEWVLTARRVHWLMGDSAIWQSGTTPACRRYDETPKTWYRWLDGAEAITCKTCRGRLELFSA